MESENDRNLGNIGAIVAQFRPTANRQGRTHPTNAGLQRAVDKGGQL
jgi:hypothetical protein